MSAARRDAYAALAVGLAYAAVSAYWGLGGTRLLSTVGGEIERQALSRDAGILALLWVAVALKALGAIVPLGLLSRPPGGRGRWLRRLAWAECVLLIAYGGVLTAVGLLVQAGAVAASAHADRRALAWHAYLWDPWFLVWGLLVLAVLMRTGRQAT